MSIGTFAKNTAKWTGIGVGAVVAGTVGAVGYLGYKILTVTAHIGHEYIEHPTLKKTAALAIVPFAIYGLRYPTGAVEGAGKALNKTGTYISETVNHWSDKRVEALGIELNEKESAMKRLESEKNNLEKMVYSGSKGSGMPSAPGAPSTLGTPSAPASTSPNRYLDNFADEFVSMIYVDKTKNELHLMRSTGKTFIEVAKYYCTTGQNPAPKSKDGDKASPEGIFYATPERKQWNESFAPAKLNLTLPRSMGSGILITGTYNPEMQAAISNHQSASNGGIVLKADDYMDLHRKVESEQVIPVVITSQFTKTLLDYTGGAH